MIFTSENNWYNWSYGSDAKFGRQTHDHLEFKTSFSCGFAKQAKSFKEELHNAARSTLDYSNTRPTVLFSGGVDSEIMLRAFLEIGANPKIVIVRYENDYNIYDVSYAVTICSMLNVDYEIIDFNLQKFYNNDAEAVSELSQIDRPRALPYCKILEMIDGFPVLGASDLSLVRTTDDYSIKATWMIRCWEHDVGWSKFLIKINKPGIAEWFKWTPGLVISYMNTTWFNKLVNDEYFGKLGANSTKIIGYREAYPNLIDRKKQTGFEQIDFLIEEIEQHLNKKYNGFPYRQYVDRNINDLRKEITLP